MVGSAAQLTLKGFQMPSDELALFTCDELIGELMRRQTFFGCVVHSADDHRHDDWDERTFRVHFNGNLSRESAGRLLDTVATQIGASYD